MTPRRAPFALVLAGSLSCLIPAAPAWAARPNQPAKTPDAKALPGAAELFDRYIKAIGGDAAIRAIKSRIIEGTMTPNGDQAKASKLSMRQIAPDKLVAVMEQAGGGSREVGYDGTIGWSRGPTGGPQVMAGDALAQLKQTADIYQEANYKERYKEMQTLGQTEFAARPAYEVRAVDASGKAGTMYFDTENGLLLGTRHDQPTSNGTVPVTMVLSDYKSFGNVLHPTRLTQTGGGQEVVIAYTSIRVNAADVGVIEAPPELAGKK